jgi:hypothetical protein
VEFAQHGVATDAFAEGSGDDGGGLTVTPERRQALDAVVGPEGHGLILG